MEKVTKKLSHLQNLTTVYIIECVDSIFGR
ncbi:hypothetical protein [Acinetobacter baumannii]|nr:hypothetical protein [Acinetobacter baumannii]MCC0747174.1 hypothetical protein [Acinetobacter baumannii]MDC5284527.1 hypothetical protein [Acinetobacter baumannii]MDC5313498.1 hypothetical protein [Acinetobacter baumannii]MDF9436997.1 hypothetical protein [Acinetobacter baumannii]MDY7264927.1 hypothetical protein [Acinetobacter baumannii]